MLKNASGLLKLAAWFQAVVGLMNILFVIYRLWGGIEWQAVVVSFAIYVVLLSASFGVAQGRRLHIVLSGIAAVGVLVLYAPFYVDQTSLLFAGNLVFKDSPGLLIALTIGAGLTVVPAFVLITLFLIYVMQKTRARCQLPPE